MFFRKVGPLSTDYLALYPRMQNFPSSCYGCYCFTSVHSVHPVDGDNILLWVGVRLQGFAFPRSRWRQGMNDLTSRYYYPQEFWAIVWQTGSFGRTCYIHLQNKIFLYWIPWNQPGRSTMLWVKNRHFGDVLHHNQCWQLNTDTADRPRRFYNIYSP
jgi:hypothetical protein